MADPFLLRAEQELSKFEKLYVNLTQAENKIHARREFIGRHVNSLKTAIEVYREMAERGITVQQPVSPEEALTRVHAEVLAPPESRLPAVFVAPPKPALRHRVLRFLASIKRGFDRDVDEPETTHPQCPQHGKGRRAKDGHWYCPTLIVNTDGRPYWCDWHYN